MGKDLKGKELGVGISQRSDEFYVGRYTTKHAKIIPKITRVQTVVGRFTISR